MAMNQSDGLSWDTIVSSAADLVVRLANDKLTGELDEARRAAARFLTALYDVAGTGMRVVKRTPEERVAELERLKRVIREAPPDQPAVVTEGQP